MNLSEGTSPRITTILLHAFYGAAAISCIWFVSWFLSPKAKAFAHETHLSFHGIVSMGQKLSDIASNGFWLLAALCVSGVVLSFFARCHPFLRRPAVATLIGTSLVSTMLALFLLITAWFALHDAWISLHHKNRVYSRALDGFALRESAEGRFLSVQDAFNRVQGIQPKRIEDISQLSPLDQRQRLALIIEQLPRPADVPRCRRLLATSLYFRRLIEKDQERSFRILQQAREAGAPQTENIREFYDWLAGNLNRDGWDPIPLYEMKYQPGA